MLTNSLRSGHRIAVLLLMPQNDPKAYVQNGANEKVGEQSHVRLGAAMLQLDRQVRHQQRIDQIA